VVVNATHQVSVQSAVPRWTPRESELLAVTLRLLRQHGYERLTVEAVATEAKASKSTVYRRWPSKAELVLAAFIEGVQLTTIAPHTGSLRTDLLQIGTMVCEQSKQHAATLRAVLNELPHMPALEAALRDKFVHHRKALISEVLVGSVDRGEIDAEAVNDEIWDVLSGYLGFRALVPGRPPTIETVRMLVDEVLMPSLTRHR
jgi:AcrR family transcriptional regulator